MTGDDRPTDRPSDQPRRVEVGVRHRTADRSDRSSPTPGLTSG